MSVWFCGLSQNNIAYLGWEELSASTSTAPESASNATNFTFSEGLILVNAVVDGIPGQFILDTGAPGLVLNSTEKTERSVFASSVNSAIEVGEVKVENFGWGNFEKTDFEAYTLDLSHMARENKANPDGLIGYQILENKAVMVDFENESIAMLSRKDLKKHLKTSKNFVSIPFVTEGHLPILKVKINGKTYRFAIDTGAEKNLLNETLFKKTNPENVKYELMQGLDGGIRKVAIGEVENLKAKKYKIEKMKFLYSDLSGVTSGEFGYQIDGLLGLPFFQNKTFAIDYRKGQLHIWQ